MNNRISNVTITFGNQKTKEGNPIIAGELAIRTILLKVASIFGGYTLTRGHGGWYDSERKVLVEETCVIINIAIVGDQPRQRAVEPKIYEIVALIKKLLDQDCVLVQLSHGTSELI